MTGVVESVAPLPDPGNFRVESIKVYTTKVRIDKSPTGIRPGMTAQVEHPRQQTRQCAQRAGPGRGSVRW